MSTTKPMTLRIAVLVTFEAQMLDLAGIDLLGMLDKSYVQYMPGPLSKLGMDVHIFYVGIDDNKPSTTAPNLRGLTGQAQIKADNSVNDEVVQPGELDILLIPGPPPGEKQSEQTLDFVRRHAQYGTTILSICTGCYVVASAGIADGRKASGPRGLVPSLRKEFPAINWDDQRRFVKDTTEVKGKSTGELWSSGGITNGLEMVAAFIREKYPGPLAETVCAMADVGEKGELYDTSVSVDSAWWLGQILRAFFFGKRS